MVIVNCEWCGKPVHQHDSVEFGWWGQFAPDDVVVLHRGDCERSFDSWLREPADVDPGELELET